MSTSMTAPLASADDPRHDVVVVLEGDGTAMVTINGLATSISDVDADAARSYALRLVVDEARRTNAPVHFLAIDAKEQREAVAHPDGSIRRPAPVAAPVVTPVVAPAPVAPGGRGRVSKLPAADTLQVPDREDTGTAVRGTPLGSPADAPVAARPVSSRPILAGAGVVDTVDEHAVNARRARRRRRRRATALIAVVVVVPGGLAGGAWWHEHAAAEAQRAAVAAEARSQVAEQQWIADQHLAARRAAGDARRAGLREQVTARRDEAIQLLGASQGRVADDAVRVGLSTAISLLTSSLNDGNPMSWAAAAASVDAQAEQVRAAQAAWDVAEQQRVAAEQAAAAAAAAAAAGKGTSAAPSRGTTPAQQAPAQQGPAQQPATETPAEGRVIRIDPGKVESGVGFINISAVVTTNGSAAVTATATISGRTVTLTGPATVNGTATYSESISGLTAGTHTWSVAANGLSTTTRTIEVF